MKRATLKDVAELAGVSKATVSYIMNNRKKTISQETRERVQKAMEELHYVPSIGAAALTNKSSRLIGVVIPQTEPGDRLMFENGFYSEILGSIEYQARQLGYHLIISATDVNESYRKLVVERNLDGVIVIGMYPDAFYQQLREIEVPVVMIDSYCTDRYFHNIRLDDEKGGYLAARYMLEHGHRKLGILSGLRRDHGVVEKRIAGSLRAIAEAGIRESDVHFFEGEVSFAHGIEAAKRIITEQMDLTGLIATADILAIGAIRGFRENGEDVPDSYSVIGFDDLQIAQYLTPGLTTIRQEIAKKGETAVTLLAESIRNPGGDIRDVILPLTIIERESVNRV